MFRRTWDELGLKWSKIRKWFRKEDEKKAKGDAVRLWNTVGAVIVVLELIRVTLELYKNIPCA